jgi:hypothetical protein
MNTEQSNAKHAKARATRLTNRIAKKREQINELRSAGEFAFARMAEAEIAQMIKEITANAPK